MRHKRLLAMAAAILLLCFTHPIVFALMDSLCPRAFNGFPLLHDRGPVHSVWILCHNKI